MAVIDQPSRGPEPDDHAHPAHLAHHFDEPVQQFEAAKLGMWLFLATEFLLFGGLFCAYAIARANHTEIFAYGSQFLDTRWGAINTLVLIMSSLSMAMAVTAAQCDRRRLLIAMLMATFMGGAIFMGIKFIEYHHKIHEHLLWGTAFYEKPAWVAVPGPDDHTTDVAGAAAVDEAPREPDVVNGELLWGATCRSCHGAAGEGVPGQGKDLRGNEFVAARGDVQLVDFLKMGRAAADPLNTTGVLMPPRGGNPLLSDADLLDIVAFVRALDPTAVPPPADGPGVVGGELWIPKSSLPPAREGPSGLARAAPVTAHAPVFPHHTVDPDRPAHAHIFFGIYFCMTGLHGLHVLVGMVVIAWLCIREIRGHFGSSYFTPIDLGGLYWHVVDVIWIFLFPLLYLIG